MVNAMTWKKSKKSIGSTSMQKSIPFQNFGFVNFKLTDEDPGNAILRRNFSYSYANKINIRYI